MQKLFILSLIILVSLGCDAKNKVDDISKSIDIPNIIEEVLNKDTTQLTNYELPLKKLLDSLKITSSDIQIYISKSDFTLSVKKDTLVIKSYPVVFGFNETDDKRQQGDGCTPEGDFYIVDKYPHASWSKFIWINYPTADSWKKHKASKTSGEISEDASIGGEIGIHGVPGDSDYLIDMKQNWTLGCISLKNKDVNDVYPYISKSTLIRIVK